MVGKILEQNNEKFGFDAYEGKYTDMIEHGVIDPAKVVKTALQDAASVASLMITTESMIVEEKEDKPAMPAGGAGGMGGMGGMPGMYWCYINLLYYNYCFYLKSIVRKI